MLLVYPAFRKVRIATRLWQCLLAHARKLRLTQVRAEILSHFLRSQKNPKNPLHGFKGTSNDRVLQLEQSQHRSPRKRGLGRLARGRMRGRLFSPRRQGRES